MATDIEWADETWNPTTGCKPVSEGCRNCYAAAFAQRGLIPEHHGLTKLLGRRAVFNGRIKLHESRLDVPLHWAKPRRVFVDSMSDLYHGGVPTWFIDRVFATMALCPWHTFLILTKRPQRAAEYTSGGEQTAQRIARCIVARRRPTEFAIGESTALRWPLPNVWLGTSCENQATADARIPELARSAAAIRFLSCEPLLGPIRLALDGVDWLIVGGESGPAARPCHLVWIREIVYQCQSAGVPVFIKQLGRLPMQRERPPRGDDPRSGIVPVRLAHPKGGAMHEWPEDLWVREWPNPAFLRESRGASN